MTEELKRINQKYNDETYPVFPFISKDRIHILSKGLYRKKDAKFRGVTAKYDEDKEAYVFPLYGMYYLPEDIVIVPDDIDLSSSKNSLYHAAIKAGYKKVSKPPLFQTTYLPEDSPEAKAALSNRSLFHAAGKIEPLSKDITL